MVRQGSESGADRGQGGRAAAGAELRKSGRRAVLAGREVRHQGNAGAGTGKRCAVSWLPPAKQAVAGDYRVAEIAIAAFSPVPVANAFIPLLGKR